MDKDEIGCVVGMSGNPNPIGNVANVNPMEIETVDNGKPIITSHRRPFPTHRGAELEKAWPKVKSALDERGISSTLNLVEGYMEVSVERKSTSTVPIAFQQAFFLTLLLSIGTPADKALRQLNSPPEILLIGHQKKGLCSLRGINKEQYQLQRKLLSNSTMKALSELTRCDLYLHEDLFVAVAGSPEGIKLAKKIVMDCVVHRLRPASQIRKLKRMNGLVDELGALRF